MEKDQVRNARRSLVQDMQDKCTRLLFLKTDSDFEGQLVFIIKLIVIDFVDI